MSKVKLEKDYDFLHIDGIDEETFRESTDYNYNGFPVPRVTHILRACTDQSGLISWAASMNYHAYKNIKEKALTVGTVVHEMIDNYLRFIVGESKVEDDYPFIYSELSDSYKMTADQAYENFKNWYQNFTYMGYRITKIIDIEKKLECPIYGGTADAIVTINDKWDYILDFKTSKEINFSYLLQLAAYQLICNCNGGIGVIRVDKSFDGVFNDLFIPESHPDMNYYKQCFLSMVETYYRTIGCSNIYNAYCDMYNIGRIFT